MPASTLIGVKRLVHDDLLLEVEVVAAVAEKAAPARARMKKA
jgi:enamine deaminase RidA (YjgF/YER057c/UK114 family)